MPTVVHTTQVVSEGGIPAATISPVMTGGGDCTVGGFMGGELFVFPETANDGKTPNPLRQEWRIDLELPGFAQHLEVDPALFAADYDEAIKIAEAHGETLDKLWAAITGIK